MESRGGFFGASEDLVGKGGVFEVDGDKYEEIVRDVCSRADNIVIHSEWLSSLQSRRCNIEESSRRYREGSEHHISFRI